MIGEDSGLRRDHPLEDDKLTTPAIPSPIDITVSTWLLWRSFLLQLVDFTIQMRRIRTILTMCIAHETCLTSNDGTKHLGLPEEIMTRTNNRDADRSTTNCFTNDTRRDALLKID